MLVSKYLIIAGTESKHGSYVGCSGCRITTSKPKLKANERAIALEIDVPDALFLQPQLSCSIRIPEDSVNAPTINAETISNIQEVMEQQLGVSMTVQLVEPTKAEDLV